MNIIVPNGYQAIPDETALYDEATGEVVESFCALVPCGSSIETQKEKERRKREKERREERELLYYRSKKEKYVFIKSDFRFDGISPANVTRLIYLSTFLGYKGNVLMRTAKTPMTRKDLPSLLGLSERQTYNFWGEVSRYCVNENEKGYLILNNDIFKRGKLERKAYTQYQQFYQTGVRKLYEATSRRYNKQLGYLFKLLPYISVEYNIVCRNPYETDVDKVELLSISEFCDLIGYDVSHINRLLKIYNEVRFDVQGEQERFCTMIYNGLDKATAKICVNPNIFYAGSNGSRIEITKLYFKD